MKKKWHEVLLVICIILCMSAGVALCFKYNSFYEMLPAKVTAEIGSQKEQNSSTTPKITASGNSSEAADTAGSAGDITAVEKPGAEPSAQEDDQEQVVDDETGYNGDIFKYNGMPYCIKVNRQRNVVTIYTPDEDGYYTVPYKVMVCSVGLNNKTPTGTYKLPSDRYEWRELVGAVYGQYAVRIKNAIMFHSVPYYKPVKDQLESEEYNKLGQPASKGCVRLSVVDAKWIYDNCKKGTIVQIFDSDYIGPMGKPEAVKLDLQDARSCYDPTDESEDNPWFQRDDAQDVQDAPAAEEEITDFEAPKIVLKADAPKVLTESQAQNIAYMKTLVEVTDESEISEVHVSLPLWVSKKISYRVVYTARDIYGNVATAYFSFEVED